MKSALAADHSIRDARRGYTAAYSKWLHAAARLADESRDADDDLIDDLATAEEKAAVKFLAMRPPLRWLLLYKFELLDRVLAKEDQAGVRDREREMHTLAAIKTDLLYFGFGGP
jgi:hypothetical protein